MRKKPQADKKLAAVYRENRRGDLRFFKMVVAWLGFGLLLMAIAIVILLIIINS